MNVKRLFNSLVESAIDFGEKSVDELKNRNAKHSLINFCTALELFLKARLMLEHWSLVVTRPQDARPQKFERGDFHSVSMDEAIERLEHIAGQSFSAKEKTCFQLIREQRNRMVHFFDPSTAKKKKLQSVAAQECVGWFYLYELLQKRWKQEFKKFHPRIKILGQHLHESRTFLKAKYSELKQQIGVEQKKGVQFEKCPICEFESYRVIGKGAAPKHATLVIMACMVCELKNESLIVECPNCGESVRIEDMGEGNCSSCGHDIDTDELVEMFTPGYDPKDEEPDTAYCTNCERTDCETVVPTEDGDGYVCVSCFCPFSEIGNCGFCNSRNAGDIDSTDSYLSGCVMCEGMTAQDNT